MKTKVIKIILIISSIVAFMAFGLILLCFILSKASIPVISNYPVTPAINYPLNSYDYDSISADENDFRYYSQDNNIVSSLGVDVSYFQGDIDWEKVKADGVDFAIMRVGYRGRETGLINLDENFHTNMQNASKAGLKLGVYFFSQAINEKESQEEADYVINQIKEYSLDYPIIFDWEGAETDNARTMNIDEDTITNLCVAFCERVIQAGYKPMIYSNKEFTANLLDLEKLANYPFWYAEYQDKPSLHHNFTIWQYTHQGTVDGINTPVDLNISFTQYSNIHSIDDSINDLESLE